MKKRLTTLLIVLLFVAGLSLVLYPAVADYISTMRYRRVISDFKTSVDSLDEETYRRLLADAHAYNERLAANGFMKPLNSERQAEYESLLDITGTGIMGYVEVTKISAYLPIYHGTSEDVLQSGIGHLEGSSLPVGGETTHAVISGHRGLPSAKLFTNIDQLVEGDVFTLYVLKEVLTYEVDDIQVVLPYELRSLELEKGEDYCTLVTCTPYGVNTHRLLVRGHRIPTPENPEGPPQALFGMDDGRIFGMDAEIFVLLVITVLLIIVILVIYRLKYRRAGKYTKKSFDENHKGANERET